MKQVWDFHDSVLVRLAVKHIDEGKSVYSQVKLLRHYIQHRSWESIRSRINRVRKLEGHMAKKAKSKKVAPSKRQAPSQREITVKDLRDINGHFKAVRESMFRANTEFARAIEAMRKQQADLTHRVEMQEDFQANFRAATGQVAGQLRVALGLDEQPTSIGFHEGTGAQSGDTPDDIQHQ